MRRRGEEKVFFAALQGIDLKLKEASDEPEVTITEDQAAKAMKSINETLARKQREAAERGRQ